MKRLICLALCLVLLLSLLAGCNREPAPYIPTGSGLANDDGTTNPPAVDPDALEQELTLAYYADKPMNPLLTADFTNTVLFSLMYQSLFVVDRNYQVYPMLCREYTVSQDMRTYIFYPEQATFSDGSVLTVEDVFASLDYAMTKSLYKGRFLHVTGLEMTVDGGVVIKLDVPCDSLPMLLTIPILKKDQIEAEYPVGTGPYYLENVTGGRRLRQRKDWWCNAEMSVTASSIPLVEATSPAQIRDNFEFFDVGLVCADPCSDTYADFRCDYELSACENGAFVYLGCNMESELFSNPAIRSALTYAIDRDYLVTEYYRDFGMATTLPASPSVPYYSAPLARRYSYDPQRFQEALSNAGKLGATVTILVNKDDSMRVSTANAIADMLEDCGLIANVKLLNGYYYTGALQSQSYDIYLGVTRLSANMDLTVFFKEGAALRHGKIADPTLYGYCKEALANEGNYYNLHKQVADDGRITSILFQSYAVYSTRGLLTGITPSRDNVFYYRLDKTMASCLGEYVAPQYVQRDDGLPKYRVKSDSGLNLRAEASVNSDVLVRLPKDAIVSLEKRSGGWAYIRYRTYIGWVSYNYLEKVDEPAETPE